jgi:hypothetical protein
MRAASDMFPQWSWDITDGNANDQVPNWTRRGDRLLFFMNAR